VSISRPLHPNDRTCPPMMGSSESGQSTKSLRDSPLRGGKSRETVAGRWTAIVGGKVTVINKPTVGMAACTSRSSASR
jgi:hypothetical protein